MKLKFLKKYFSIIFVVATLMGVFHHHDTLEAQDNCQICIVQSSIADGDIPVQAVYFHEISQCPSIIISKAKILQTRIQENPLHARAPPKIS